MTSHHTMQRSLIAAAVLLAAVVGDVGAQTTHRLTADSGRFLLDGTPFQIISGEMHYARVPREYWHDRLRKARAMGLNTVSTYVFWNYHERTPGHYDFSGQRDIAAFIRAAREEGLHVILRPGPYVCAEWELGGYPGWLLADTTVVLRSTDPRFTGPAERWLDRLGRELGPLMSDRGGPIIAVQVENEYGSFDHDKAYLAWQVRALRHAGLAGALLYTADGDVQLAAGTLPELPAVVNFGPGEADSAFARLHRFRPNGPLMSGEYWDGWFDSWGQPHHTTNLEQQRRELAWMLDHGYSVNLYMFHGGTTPGFMNGANIDRGRYLPQTSDYDYDAALDEGGRPTAKYMAFRDVIAAHEATPLPPVPTSDSTIAVPRFELREVRSLWSHLGHGIASVLARTMEQYGQSYGYIVYRTHVAVAGRSVLRVRDVRDYAQVYVDSTLVGTLDRRLKQDSLPIEMPVGGADLTLVVENAGRVNFGKALRGEWKGIAGVSLGGHEVTGWRAFPEPMLAAPKDGFRAGRARGPAFYRGAFVAGHPADTFLDTRGWGKGTVWVNGHQLGRFWDIGAQQTLYVPRPWLRRGRNEVVVFALVPPREQSLQAVQHAVYETPGYTGARP